MMDVERLIDLHSAPGVNNITAFAATARTLDLGRICDLYDELRRAAPRRHSRGKRYLVGRTGVPNSGEQSNRREEHFAIALYRKSCAGAAFAMPDGRPLSIIDYQTPLKARLSDQGLGKIDLFGVVDGCVPCVIELKVEGTKASLGDTPLRALLEALAYCAVVEANVDDIRSEAAEQYGIALTEARPALVVMAPAEYWTGYLGHPKAGEWISAIRDLAAGITDAMHLEVHLLALLDAGFEMGLEGKPPRLTGDPRVVSLAELAADAGQPDSPRVRRRGEQRVTTEGVKAAISERLRTIAGPDAMRLDMPNYTRSLPQNFLAGKLDKDIRSDFSGGDGGELGGDPPKMCAAHSSSALAVNAFGPFRSHPERLILAGLDGFTQANFEKKLPTGLLGTPPNLDFVASGGAGVVAIESKFTEVLGAKKAKFAASYEGAIDRLAEPAWREVYRSLLADPARFTRLDAAQLVKHYLGMRHSLAQSEGRQVLVYLYWEPTNARDSHVFSQHRREVEEFAKALEGSEVRFHSLRHSSLWTQWEAGCEWNGIGQHVASLRQRYELALPL